jgi:beta-lactamase regulating signal transducer with metallopeptidase domain
MATAESMGSALSWLATYAVHSTLLLGATWLLCSLGWPRTNRTRERLWKLAMIGGVVTASLQVSSGARPWLGRWHWSAPAESCLAVATRSHEPEFEHTLAREERSSTRESSPGRADATSHRERRATVPALATGAVSRTAERAPEIPVSSSQRTAAPESVAPPARLAPAEPLPWRARWPYFVFGGWTVVGLAGGLAWLLAFIALRRRLAGRTRLTSGALVERLEALRARAGLRRKVRLSVSERVSAPFSTGLLRPEICLPRAALHDLGRAQQDALLAHELAHLVRRDPLWFTASFLLEKALFFQPLNRLARRRLSELAELACDDWAVRWTGARLALASCLTEVAGWMIGERTHACSPALGGERSRLGRRIARLLDDRRSPTPEARTPWWPPLALVALGLLATTLPSIARAAPDSARNTLARLKPEPTEQPTRRAVSTAPPIHAPELDGAAPLGVALHEQRRLLGRELAGLELELLAFQGELVDHRLEGPLSDALDTIATRLRTLREQEARLDALLLSLASPLPASEPASAAPAPTTSVAPGESR